MQPVQAAVNLAAPAANSPRFWRWALAAAVAVALAAGLWTFKFQSSPTPSSIQKTTEAPAGSPAHKQSWLQKIFRKKQSKQLDDSLAFGYYVLNDDRRALLTQLRADIDARPDLKKRARAANVSLRVCQPVFT
jgi:hypothetical protein